MNVLVISLIVVLLVIFLIIALTAFLNRSYRVIYATADDNIESRLRIIMLQNPNSEIVVLDTGDSEEIHTILEKLEKDYPNIHIKNGLE